MINNLIIDSYLSEDEKKSLNDISNPRNIRGKTLSILINSKDISDLSKVRIKSSLKKIASDAPSSITIETLNNVFNFFEDKKDMRINNTKLIVDSILSAISPASWNDPNNKWFIPFNDYGILTINIYHKLMIGLSKDIPDDFERRKHIVENMLFIVGKQDINMFVFQSSIDMYSELNFNVYDGELLDNNLNSYISDIWNIEKFDIGIFNPIFKGRKYITEIKKSSELCKLLVCLSLSSWVFLKRTQNVKVINRIQYMNLINGNALFDSEFGSPICVMRIGENDSRSVKIRYDTTNNSYTVKSIPSGFYEPVKIMIDLKEKFESITKYNCLGDLLDSGTSEYIVSAPRICGHTVLKANKNRFFRRDFYILFYRNSNLNNKNTKNSVYITNSNEERENLIHYMKTKIARFGLLINKTTQDSHTRKYLKNIPLPDLKNKYNDAELCKIYEITEKEWKFIDNIIEDYY